MRVSGRRRNRLTGGGRALIPAHPAAREVIRALPRNRLRSIHLGDPSEAHRGSRIRWFVSTCVAATVGVVAIGGVIYGSMDSQERAQTIASNDPRPLWERVWDLEKLKPAFQTPRRAETREIGLTSGKSDRLPTSAGALVTRHIIHDDARVRVGSREKVVIKHYLRLSGRLATTPPQSVAEIPPFNPFRLYANLAPIDENGDGAQRAATDNDVSVKVVELLGGFLPEEDGQELEADVVSSLVTKAGEEAIEPAELRQSHAPEGSEAAKTANGPAGSAPNGTAADPAAKPAVAAAPPNTTILTKATSEADEDADVEGRETRGIRVAAGENLMGILRKVGSEMLQARLIVDAANTVFPVAQLKEGNEVRLTLAPSPTSAARFVPVRMSIYGEAHQHRVTVVRNTAGEYVVAGGAVDAEIAGSGEGDQAQHASLYTSLYHAVLGQRVPADIVELILRVNAYDIDFKRRVRPGDGFELFFDQKDDEKGGEPAAGELLFTALTAVGETKRFYRFRTPDGVVEFYDEQGNNSKKFLMRKPVRGEEARLTSGYGMRFHPLYRVQRMHTGIDWAAPTGTPILAAGGGVIEEAGRKNAYGNYVRIRHANGYKTTYGHMVKFAAGVAADARVQQGQIIGFVGSTGSSTGAHLHFEILVNNNFVDPMRIQVPRERRLTGRELADFQKERGRIDELMKRAPVSTRVFSDAPQPKGPVRRAADITTSTLLQSVRK
jgi:murein DD-endopeptidase MepM/ murein hydrolase activator NlpD